MDFITGLKGVSFHRLDHVRHLISGRVGVIADFLNEENIITNDGKTWHVCNIEQLPTDNFKAEEWGDWALKMLDIVDTAYIPSSLQDCRNRLETVITTLRSIW